MPGEASLMCSCGGGKVGAEFLKVNAWLKFAPCIMRCTVSPLFPAPFVDQTRTSVISAFTAGDQILWENIVCLGAGLRES